MQRLIRYSSGNDWHNLGRKLALCSQASKTGSSHIRFVGCLVCFQGCFAVLQRLFVFPLGQAFPCLPERCLQAGHNLSVVLRSAKLTPDTSTRSALNYCSMNNKVANRVSKADGACAGRKSETCSNYDTTWGDQAQIDMYHPIPAPPLLAVMRNTG